MRVIVVAGTKTKSGGNIVLLSIISILKDMGVDVSIFCLDNPVSISWKQRHPEITQISYDEVRHSDTLIISEEFVFAAMQLGPKCQKYIIINQGIGSSFASDWKRNTYAVTKSIYDNAQGIIANSLHTASGIVRVFDQPKDKITIFPVPISSEFSTSSTEKENIISFMPRKNREVQAFVVSYLSGRYLDYEFISIDNMNEQQIAEILQKSKFFLSFGGPEGLGMPPLEAALCKCKVIGFDGYGGAEYFNEPIFTKVNFYNHLEFLDLCDREICKGYNWSDDMETQRVNIKSYYSMNNLRSIIQSIYEKYLRY